METQRLSVLFLCTGNSARSQMAEAILRHLSKGAFEVFSAGSSPQPEVHPMARRAVEALLKVPLANQHPKHLHRFCDRRFDYIITVCDRAAESCPVFPGDPERIHWSFDDPAAVAGDDETRQKAFDAIARQLLGRMRLWMALPRLRNVISEHSSHGEE